jgi:hypothetical protein
MIFSLPNSQAIGKNACLPLIVNERKYSRMSEQSEFRIGHVASDVNILGLSVANVPILWHYRLDI